MGIEMMLVCVIGKMVSVMKSGRPYDAFLAHLLEQANTLKQSSMKLALVPILSTLATKCCALVWSVLATEQLQCQVFQGHDAPVCWRRMMVKDLALQWFWCIIRSSCEGWSGWQWPLCCLTFSTTIPFHWNWHQVINFALFPNNAARVMLLIYKQSH